MRSPYDANVTIVTIEGEDREGFCFSVGTACRETRDASWRKAAVEAVQGRYLVRYLRGGPSPPRGAPRTFTEHALYYSYYPEELAGTVLARGAAPGESPTRPLPGPVLARLVTPAGVPCDWSVLRVLVPGLRPLYAGHDGGGPPHPFP